MKKTVFFVLIILFWSVLLNGLEYQIPKVLFLTTGDGDGRGTVSDGIILAMQEFNKLGAFVRLENRKILHMPDKLAEYTVLIAPTSYGYHDGDREYSLSYLSDIEMKNIKNWIKNGGTFVSDTNIGRNKISGEDRITIKGELNSENWELSECFGIALKEMNMKGYRISSLKKEIWQSDISDKFDEDEWDPVISRINSKAIETLAVWENGKNTFPAVVTNKFFKGNTVLLGTFNIVHPANDGGFSNTVEIQKFYNYVYELSVHERKYSIYLNPWKNAAQNAFCLTFDDGGSTEEYDRIFSLIDKYNLKTIFFVTDNLEKKHIKKLRENKLITLESHSHSHPDFRNLNYARTVDELLLNRSDFNLKFNGFRFPFYSNSFWGMMVLEELGMKYDTSIAANHLEFYRGSLFPYNIPIFKDGFYKSLDLLEISPIYHDDWYFYQKVLLDKPYDSEEQKNDADRFDAYLKTFWERAVKPEHGLMVFVGHPMYSGISEITIKPLYNLIERIKRENVWITDLNEIAAYWNKLKELSISVKEQDDSIFMTFDLENYKNIRDLSFKLPKNPKKITFAGKYSVKKNENGLFIVFDSIQKGSEVRFEF